MINIPTLTEALQAIGNGQVFVGNPLIAGQMVALGAKEGAVTVEIEEQFNDLTAPELTGPTVHQRTLMGVNARVTIPVILGDTALYAKISPVGSRSGGWSSPQATVPTSVLVIPNQEVGGGLENATGLTGGWTRTAGNGVAGGSGAGVAPVHAVWLWRAVPGTPARGFSYENGGKIITPVTFQAMFDATKPEGHKVYTVGDPTAQGITTIRI
jgi:hypothetical protein